MFERVCAVGQGRPRGTRTAIVAASAAAHLVAAAAIASVPLGPVLRPPSVESATYLVLLETRHAPGPPARRDAGSGAAESAAPREPDGGVPAPLDPPAAVPPAAEAPPPLAPAPAARMATAADIHALALHVPAGYGEGAASDASAPTDGSGAGDGPVVIAAEMLAEVPRMVNRQEITRLLGRLYPGPLRRTGVQGQVELAFIIGLDGRVETRTIRVVAATHPGLVQPTLQAVERMRFRPARLRGQPVRVRANLPVHWVLRRS